MNDHVEQITDGYVDAEEVNLLKQLKLNIDNAFKQREIRDLAQQKAQAEMRAAEAEMRAAEAEYGATIMKLLWKYKLENTDKIRQSDGFIMKGVDSEKENIDVG